MQIIIDERELCEDCQTSHTRNSYYRHLKSKRHLSVVYEAIVPIGKICGKCKCDKPLNEYYCDNTKEDGRKSQCIECIKSDNNRKIICECGKEISFSNKAKHV